MCFILPVVTPQPLLLLDSWSPNQLEENKRAELEIGENNNIVTSIDAEINKQGKVEEPKRFVSSFTFGSIAQAKPEENREVSAQLTNQSTVTFEATNGVAVFSQPNNEVIVEIEAGTGKTSVAAEPIREVPVITESANEVTVTFKPTNGITDVRSEPVKLISEQTNDILEKHEISPYSVENFELTTVEKAGNIEIDISTNQVSQSVPPPSEETDGAFLLDNFENPSSLNQPITMMHSRTPKLAPTVRPKPSSGSISDAGGSPLASPSHSSLSNQPIAAVDTKSNIPFQPITDQDSSLNSITEARMKFETSEKELKLISDSEINDRVSAKLSKFNVDSGQSKPSFVRRPKSVNVDEGKQCTVHVSGQRSTKSYCCVAERQGSAGGRGQI